jgi:DNA excision repair protein ERCC-4
MSGMSSKSSSMIIIQDTREQTPYSFSCITPPPMVEVATLRTGDYSLKGYEDQIAIERKNLADCYGTFGQGRARFQRELERAINFKFFAVVIEADFHTIVKRPPARSRLIPKTVISSIAAWSQRYGVHFWTVPDREFGERWTYRLLERFHRDRQKESLLKK